MRVVSCRVFAFVAAFILAVASFVPVTAQTSDSVVVTGSIVAAPLSIQISNTTVAFGAMDYRATAQAAPASSTGFLAPDNNGAFWVATTPVEISVVSPSNWSISACISASGGLPGPGLYGLPGMPADAAAANVDFLHVTAPISSGCPAASAWRQNISAGQLDLTRYLGTWVVSGETPRSFSATVLFSVSN